MTTLSNHSQAEEFQAHLDRMNSGDTAATDELFRHAGNRLERLARKMLRGFPGVHRWAQTDDVLQSALIRLLRSLHEVKPATAREFFALSTQQMRRELIDLSRHYFGPHGTGANHQSQAGISNGEAPAYESSTRSNEPSLLACWSEFHREVDCLPVEEREVIDLLFYHEMPQAEAAALLGVTVRTVQRRWQAALLHLHEILKGLWPGL
jgi:RNA polymerase sigma-70 factor (ECF subfamily)